MCLSLVRFRELSKGINNMCRKKVRDSCGLKLALMT